uniref:Uncharacterized protein n=1 Tax=Arundo donax TaxID=35708 RepID=A0A0A9GLU7_ARUDO
MLMDTEQLKLTVVSKVPLKPMIKKTSLLVSESWNNLKRRGRHWLVLMQFWERASKTEWSLWSQGKIILLVNFAVLHQIQSMYPLLVLNQPELLEP